MKDSDYLCSGVRRDVYQNPYQPKISIELKAYIDYELTKDKHTIYQTIFGLINTNKSIGLIVSACKNENGDLAETLHK